MNLRSLFRVAGATVLLAQPAVAQRPTARADTLRLSVGEAVTHAITDSNESASAGLRYK